MNRDFRKKQYDRKIRVYCQIDTNIFDYIQYGQERQRGVRIGVMCENGP